MPNSALPVTRHNIPYAELGIRDTFTPNQPCSRLIYSALVANGRMRHYREQ
jgi:hypothetical protein